VDAGSDSCNLLLTAEIQLKGDKMNTDLALTLMAAVSGLFGFLLGYAKGHEHGKISGRIARNRELRMYEQVGR
jgi:hypothetical protein